MNFIETTLFFFLFFSHIIIFSIFDNKILMYAWRSYFNRLRHLTDTEVKNRVLLNQIKIYFMVVLYFILHYKFFMNPNIILINSLTIIPQLIHNILRPNKMKFDIFFLFFLTTSKYILFFFIKGIPNNLLNLKPEPQKILLGFLIISLNLIFLYF